MRSRGCGWASNGWSRERSRRGRRNQLLRRNMYLSTRNKAGVRTKHAYAGRVIEEPKVLRRRSPYLRAGLQGSAADDLIPPSMHGGACTRACRVHNRVSTSYMLRSAGRSQECVTVWFRERGVRKEDRGSGLVLRSILRGLRGLRGWLGRPVHGGGFLSGACGPRGARRCRSLDGT
jgi:hypothetical protein